MERLEPGRRSRQPPHPLAPLGRLSRPVRLRLLRGSSRSQWCAPARIPRHWQREERTLECLLGRGDPAPSAQGRRRRIMPVKRAKRTKEKQQNETP